MVSPTEVEGETFTYNIPEPVVIGRNSVNHIVLPAEEVSEFHAFLYQEGGRFYLQDLGSLNGSAITTSAGSMDLDPKEKYELVDGALVEIADSTYTLRFTIQTE